MYHPFMTGCRKPLLTARDACARGPHYKATTPQTVPAARTVHLRPASALDFPIARQRKRYWEISPGNG